MNTRWPRTRFSSLFGVDTPIVQAPMAGGPTTVELVIAVSNAGGLGSLGAAMSSPARIRAEVEAVRAGTDRPFAVNLFVLPKSAVPEDLARAIAALARFHVELGLPPITPPTDLGPNFDEQFDTVLELAPPIASFTFGILSRERIDALHARGVKIIGTATNVAEARAWDAMGADAVCAQGAEAGGHRGTFIGSFEQSLVGTIALVPQIVDAIAAPVLAAGGIMDGRGIAAAHLLGASGAQLGTAFLRCPEAGTSEIWREALGTASDDGTLVTRAFTGRPARGLVNRFMTEMRAHEESAIADYPVQGALTRTLRSSGRPELASMWSGQAASLGRELPAADLVRALHHETRTRLGH